MGWPQISAFWATRHPPLRGGGALFLEFGFVQGSETCLNFSHIFHIFFILRQTSEPFVAQCCQNWLVAEFVVALNSGCNLLGSNPSGGKFFLVSSALLFHRFSFLWY